MSQRAPRWVGVLLLTAALVIPALLHWRTVRTTPPLTPPPPLPIGARPLEEKYGPGRYSQFAEEWIIRDFFQDLRNGFFVDVGANHYRRSSTTYYLEAHLGWSGLAIEPLVRFEADYLIHRPRTRFLPFFVSDVSNQQAKMYVLDNLPGRSSATKSFTERAAPHSREITVPTITLNDLLATQAVKKIDFLSMDIELSEPQALAGFDIALYRPQLVCIEAHPEVLQEILNYFSRNGYVIVGKYLPADENNLYFMPLGGG